MTLQRTQIQLERWQHEALKRRAREEEISLSEALRQILSREFTTQSSQRRTKRERLAGFFSDPETSGRDHDEVLYP